MKIKLRNKKPLIDIDSFNKKADVIFKDVVIPQIKKYKTMKAKEKAKEIFDKMCLAIATEKTEYGYYTNVIHAKQCALIAVEEILKSNSLEYLFTKDEIYSMESTSDDRWIYDRFTEYWEEVKQEIEKL